MDTMPPSEGGGTGSIHVEDLIKLKYPLLYCGVVKACYTFSKYETAN